MKHYRKMKEEDTALEALARHAERFGTEGVLEAGTDLLDLERLEKLVRHCDEIEKRQNRGRFTRPTARRLTPRQRAERLLGITPEEETDQ